MEVDDLGFRRPRPKRVLLLKRLRSHLARAQPFEIGCPLPGFLDFQVVR
jgi:hypothetical protein